MDMAMVKKGLIGLASSLMLMTNFAHAGVIHTFTFDDVSDWNNVNRMSDGDSLSITFSDSTNFNNVQWEDILSFQFDIALGNTYKIDSEFSTRGVAAELFSENNGIVSMVFSALGPKNSLYGYSTEARTYGEFRSGSGSYNIFGTYHLEEAMGIDQPTWPDGTPINYQASLGGYDIKRDLVLTSSVAVPEPSTFAIFVLAGFMMRRFKVANEHN